MIRRDTGRPYLARRRSAASPQGSDRSSHVTMRIVGRAQRLSFKSVVSDPPSRIEPDVGAADLFTQRTVAQRPLCRVRPPPTSPHPEARRPQAGGSKHTPQQCFLRLSATGGRPRPYTGEPITPYPPAGTLPRQAQATDANDRGPSGSPASYAARRAASTAFRFAGSSPATYLPSGPSPAAIGCQ